LDSFAAFEEALESFTKSLEIRQTLTARADNAQWSRDLSISYERAGDTLTKLGKDDQALVAFKASFDIRKKLTELDPSNRQRQRDLAVAYGRIGSLMLARGQRDEGIQAFRTDLAIRERLAADPANVLWQTDLVIALRRLALAGDDSRTRLMKALEITRRLEKEDKLGAEQAGWISDLEERLTDLPK
jgi:tetratricopeptide (TPR) repeat protein